VELIMKTRRRFPAQVRLLAALSTAFLFLLIAFATYYQISLASLTEHTGVLEMMAASIPLLALLLASVFARPPAKRRQTVPRDADRSTSR
jgi:hypothetical protein